MKKAKKSRIYGIQNKYLFYTMILLSISLLLSCIGIGFFTWNDIRTSVVDKYAYMNEKIGRDFDNAYKKSDDSLESVIVFDMVQRSLTSEPLTVFEEKALIEFFAYTNLEYVSEYVYVDNKENVYTRFYKELSYEEFVGSRFVEVLEEEYSKTIWFWREDTLFGEERQQLFIGRKVHNMEYTNGPGYMVFRIDDAVFEQMIQGVTDASEVAVGIVDEGGQICKSWLPDNFTLSANSEKKLQELAVKDNVAEEIKLKEGTLTAYRQQETGFTVFTLIPHRVLAESIVRLVIVLLLIFLVVMVIAVSLSIFFARRFTKPIKEINTSMTGFDGSDFSKTLSIQTNTELDGIGESYNQMLLNIQELLEEIKLREKKLRKSELNALIHQINPHFLYNALDTIYMLARINKEETTMKMIQALSKYLKVTLSKGEDIISLEDELENVRSYMEIQKIRNENLFEYEIDCQVDEQEIMILKLILQPLVENAIKHGFCEIYDGGIIKIRIFWQDNELVLQVYNNGASIDDEMAERINHTNHMEVGEIDYIRDEKGRGYGVLNIISRLKLKYGKHIQIIYRAKSIGTEVTIKIPGRDLSETI